MCSVLGRYKGPGKDLLKNTLKLEKKKKSVFTFKYANHRTDLWVTENIVNLH